MGRTGVDAGTSVGTEIGRWIYGALIYQILVSIAYGALVGYIARKSLKWAEERQYIDKDNFFAYGLGLALFTVGTTGLFGSDDILASFVAGNSCEFFEDSRHRIDWKSRRNKTPLNWKQIDRPLTFPLPSSSFLNL